jgi:hypothetical protein
MPPRIIVCGLDFDESEKDMLYEMITTNVEEIK